MKVSELRIGQIVIIKSIGGLYSIYDYMALELGVANWQKQKHPDLNALYIIKGFKEHESFYISDNKLDVVCWLEQIDTGKGYMISNRSIILISEHDMFIGKDEFMI